MVSVGKVGWTREGSCGEAGGGKVEKNIHSVQKNKGLLATASIRHSAKFWELHNEEGRCFAFLETCHSVG